MGDPRGSSCTAAAGPTPELHATDQGVGLWDHALVYRPAATATCAGMPPCRTEGGSCALLCVEQWASHRNSELNRAVVGSFDASALHSAGLMGYSLSWGRSPLHYATRPHAFAHRCPRGRAWVRRHGVLVCGARLFRQALAPWPRGC